MKNMQPIIEVIELSHSFSSLKALTIFPADLPGELVGLIGPNGAGKTTCSISSPGSSYRRRRIPGREYQRLAQPPHHRRDCPDLSSACSRS